MQIRAKLSCLTTLIDATPRNLSLQHDNFAVQEKVEGEGCDVLESGALKTALLLLYWKEVRLKSREKKRYGVFRGKLEKLK